MRIRKKAIFLGESGVGKTSIILRHDGRGFDFAHSETLGANFIVATVGIASDVVELQMWDTAGQERFRAMVPMYLRGAAVAFLVYDITVGRTFHQLKWWIEELHRNSDRMDKNLILIVIGNKTDLAKNREVTLEEGQRFASQHNALFFETSALRDHGIAETIRAAAEQIILQTPSKGSRPGSTVSLENPSIPVRKKRCCRSN
ncbi:hypothetical protein WR25_17636 [Diploscapter pachys]|uniref:Uncharacterized protein n=1 Tax=Diploscapter pachys TaxID=2018661 RepID=A0A2A2LCJ0_9BILA|nr:hypothetical protein WR25_17636 [Diploscapter pachys]